MTTRYSWGIAALLLWFPCAESAPATGNCPNEAQIATFRVSASAPDPLLKADIKAIQQALSNNAGISLQPPVVPHAAAGAALAGSSFEDVAINGLYKFLTERARLELESYLTEELREHLCGTYGPYFPRTCVALTRNDGTGIFQTLTLEELRTPLEQDIRYLPACIIHNPTNLAEGSDIGYLLMDVYRQLTSGADKSGNILYGLTRDPHLYAECRDPGKGNNDPASRHCRMFEGMAALAAGIQVAAMTESLTSVQKAEAFVTVYVYNLALLTCDRTAAANSFDAVTTNCANYLSVRFSPPVGLPVVPVTPYLGVADKVLSSVAEMKSLIEHLKETGELLAKASGQSADDYRAQIVGLLSGLGEQVAGGYANGLCMTLDPNLPCTTDQVQAFIDHINQGVIAYAQFSAGNYVAGVSAMPLVSDHIRSTYLVPAARLAQAKNSDEFSATLNSIAAPAGAWRVKKVQDETWSVASFVGIQGGTERLHGRDYSSNGAYYGAYVPLGVAWSRRFDNQKGYWGVYLSALDLGILASSHTDRDAADAGAETELSSVLSPSVSVYVNPGLGPVTFGLGYAYRTPGLRTVTTSAGEEIELDSSRVMLTIGVDVTVFRLSR